MSAWKRQLLNAVPEVFAQGAARTSPSSTKRRSESSPSSGIFSARVEALSRAERMGMIEPDGPLSVSRQCALLRVSRSSLYYRAEG